MQDVPAAIGSSAARTAHENHPVGRFVLAGVVSGMFFAAVADGLGVVLHLMGVMPLLP